MARDHDPIPPLPATLGVPEAVESVLRTLVEKEPKRRFASADEFITALDQAVSEKLIDRRFWFAAAVGGLVLAGIARCAPTRVIGEIRLASLPFPSRNGPGDRTLGHQHPPETIREARGDDLRSAPGRSGYDSPGRALTRGLLLPALVPSRRADGRLVAGR